MTVHARCVAGPVEGSPRARLFVRYPGASRADALGYGDARALVCGAELELALAVPDTAGQPVLEFGIEIGGAARAAGGLVVDRVEFVGSPRVSFPPQLPRDGNSVHGWIHGADILRGPFSDDAEEQTRVGKNEGRGVLVTGTTDWRDYTFEARVGIHLADLGGIVVRYQGLERYVALVKTPTALRLVLRYYGDRVLAETPCAWKVDELHHLRLVASGPTIAAYLDGAPVMEAADDLLGCGGAGFVFENGLIGFRDVRVG
jgi:hypothetical protein